ncbi:ATP synthase subunit I [Dethiothermospora halolimnae]|uniref:ATP synthase subunit I n=1 Tax=Dethiothermospora halolimnae TaxID=3114390 RepID=UPI003CCBA6CC
MSLLGNTQFKVIKRVIIFSLFIIGILFFTVDNPKPYVYGFIFGTLINVLNFRLMALTLKKSIKMGKKQIMPYIVGNYIIRYSIYGLVLIIAAKADYINFITTALGFFMVKIIILADSFYETVKKN